MQNITEMNIKIAITKEEKGNLVTTIASKRQEIDLPAIIYEAVFSKIWECWCPH